METGDLGSNRRLEMRAQCECGSLFGEVRPRNGQDCVFCLGCGRFAYNEPKAERRSASTRKGIKPSQWARLMERANAHCELCGAGGYLHAGHILSVADGKRQGLTPQELDANDNLCVMCEECNLGFGSLSLSPQLYVALLRRRVGLFE